MNRPLGDVLNDILVETGRPPNLMPRNMKTAASPHLKTAHDHWIWFCEVMVLTTAQGGTSSIRGQGVTPDEAATNCYRAVLADDRSTWR